MLLLLEREFCTGELEHQGGSRVGTYFESWPRSGVGGRRAPSFYFFTPGYRHFQSNQQQSESSWGKLNQTWSAHDIISSKYQNQVKIATSFLTSWELDGYQQPRRRDKRKCKWFTVLQISVEIQIKQSTMTLWWQAHFLYLPNRRHRWTTLHFLIRLNSQQWYWSMYVQDTSQGTYISTIWVVIILAGMNDRSPVTTHKTYHMAQISRPSEQF